MPMKRGSLANGPGIVQRILLRILVICAAGVVASCAATQVDTSLLSTGPDRDLSTVSVKALADRQASLIVDIDRMAGLSQEPATPAEWGKFVRAGFLAADSQCGAYVKALYDLEIARRTTIQQLGLIQTATMGILGVVEAAREAIAITGIAFGLTQNTVDNLSSGLLYELKPPAVEQLIGQLKTAYVTSLTEVNWQDRPAAFSTLRGYIALCTPPVIAARATSAVANANVVVERTNNAVAAPPRVVIASQAITGPEDRVPPPSPPPAPQATLTPSEKVSQATIKAIQRALCITADGDVGGLPGSNSQTRTAIRRFMSGQSAASQPPEQEPDILVPPFLGRLTRAADVVGDCSSKGFLNAFEVGLFTGETIRTDVIEMFQGQMQKFLGPSVTVAVDGNLASARQAIAKTRQKLHATDTGNQVDYAFWREFEQQVPE